MITMTNGRRPLRLGFLTPHNPFDRQSFSGSSFYAAQALARHDDVDLRILGPHRIPRLRDRFLRRRDDGFTLSAADLDGLDIVVGLVATPLLETLCHLRPALPYLHVTDATPAFLRDAYGWSIPPSADERETFVVSRAARTVYSSKAMAQRAPDDLGLPTFRADVAAFGVNLDNPSSKFSEKAVSDSIELLFVGLDWARKGGDIAVATLEALRTAGTQAHLTIVGQCPKRHGNHPHITHVGYLNKNRDADRQRLAKLYAKAHLLLVPSRGDCTPMVVAEAMIHGTPVIATDTGGIRDLLGEGLAECLLPEFSTTETWARAVHRAISDRDHYAFLSDDCSERASAALSWDRWAADILRLAEETVTADLDAKAA